MGLLVCLVSYVVGFACCFGAAAGIRAEAVDPEGVGGVEVLAVILALVTLSALFGARTHQTWLSGHLRSAALSGFAAGVVTCVALFAFGVGTTWSSNPLVAVLLFVGRFTFIVWPAFILKASIAVLRRRAEPRAGEDAV